MSPSTLHQALNEALDVHHILFDVGNITISKRMVWKDSEGPRPLACVPSFTATPYILVFAFADEESWLPRMKSEHNRPHRACSILRSPLEPPRVASHC